MLASRDISIFEPRKSSSDTVSFDSFVLCAQERSLHQHGKRVRLGSRALDILVTLCARAGEVVSKEELLKTVWAGQHVDEGSLRVHISELRKVLSDGSDGNRYVINVPGHGYSFVATMKDELRAANTAPSHFVDTETQQFTYARPPLLLTRAIGREDDIERIARELQSTRFVTIVGAGGVGKTTVALAAIEVIKSDFPGSVAFVDLALVEDPAMVPTAFATALGLPVRDGEATATIIDGISDKRILIVVDNCEQVIDQAADLAHNIHAFAPNAYIIATSREPLHVSGERVHRLSALTVPGDHEETAAGILEFGSVELFVERARAIDGTFRLTDQNAPAISKICRVLDGLALAIEFAASRVAVLGTDALVGYLGQNLDLLDRSRRTAVPRHQKLRLTLDWSYRLLDKVEKHVLRRLSVFAGSFSLTAAQAIIGDGQASAAEVANALADLVDKSLVSADTAFDPVRFRLLNTTREYAAERLVEAGEVGILDRKHAAFYLEYLSEQADRTPNGSLSFLRNDLDNIRKALNWSFSDHGELAIGVPLAAASAGLFLDLALQAECAQWSSKALEKLPSRLHGTLDELHLRSNSALSQLFTQGNFPQVRSEIDRALTLARNLNDLNAKERIISGQFAFHLRGGDVPSMLETAREAEGLAQRHGDSLVGPAQSMMAAANAFAGNIEVAIPLAEGALDALPAVRKIGLLRTGVDQRIWAANSLAQTLWMSGSLDRANTVASETLREARAVGHPTPEAAALIWLIPISLWEGAYELARERVTRLMECSTRIGIASFRLAAEGHLGTLMLLEGKTDEGIARLEASASRLRGMNSKMLELGLLGNLAHGYRIAGQNHAASQKIDDALSLAKSGGTTIYIPELLRKRALIGWGETGDGQRLARNLDEALISARSVGSKMSELRTLVNFVEAERCIPERAKAARQELSNLHAKFQEGLGTADLRRAAEILVRTSDKCGSAIVFS